MPIKVQCACGKAFAAKDELAGKTVKCPNCQQPLKIKAAAAPVAKTPAKSAPAQPAAKPGATKAAAPAKASSAAARSSPAAPSPAVSDPASLFEEIGLKQVAAGTRPCPGCTEPLAEDAVVCIKCGYNTKIGRRMETMKIGMDAGAGGHGAVASDLLENAAKVMEADVEEEKKKTTAGLPWWLYLIGLAILVGFATCMLLFTGKEPPKEGKGWLTPRIERPFVLAIPIECEPMANRAAG